MRTPVLDRSRLRRLMVWVVILPFHSPLFFPKEENQTCKYSQRPRPFPTVIYTCLWVSVCMFMPLLKVFRSWKTGSFLYSIGSSTVIFKSVQMKLSHCSSLFPVCFFKMCITILGYWCLRSRTQALFELVSKSKTRFKNKKYLLRRKSFQLLRNTSGGKIAISYLSQITSPALP